MNIEEAKLVDILREAGSTFGVVADLLSTIESSIIQENEDDYTIVGFDRDDINFLKIVQIASAFVRLDREVADD